MPGIIASASRLAAALAACALAGCIPYPIYKTLQPATEVTVVDAAGAPVADADVTLIASAYPYGRERSRSTRRTDAAGRAAFERVSEWRAEALALHGAEEFFWNLCVRRPGFATHETRHRSAAAFDTAGTVVLAAGESLPCR